MPNAPKVKDASISLFRKYFKYSNLFLLSNLSSGTTGEILHVDSGYHVVGMKSPVAPDISVV